MLPTSVSRVLVARNIAFVLTRSCANLTNCLLVATLLVCSVNSYSENVKAERRRAEQILNLVSKDVQNNYYDETLKGVDWTALTDQARQRIASADGLGQMHGAISALVYELHDSHTVFIPPKRKIKAVYGFKAKPFADNIYVHELEKDGPAAKAGLQLGDQIVGVNNLNVVRGSFFNMMRYLTVLDPRAELDVEVEQSGSIRTVKVAATIVPQPPQYFFQYIETGHDADERQHFYDSKDYHCSPCPRPSCSLELLWKDERAVGANGGGRLPCRHANLALSWHLPVCTRSNRFDRHMDWVRKHATLRLARHVCDRMAMRLPALCPAVRFSIAPTKAATDILRVSLPRHRWLGISS